MMISKQKGILILKRLALLLFVLAIVAAILATVGWHILRSDHGYVIEKIKTTALEKMNADVQLAGYELEWVKPFPRIRLQLDSVSFASAKYANKPVFRTNHAVSEFNPWNVFTGNFKAQPLTLDSVWVHLYKDSLENSNLTFKDETGAKKSSSKKRINLDLKDLPFIHINFLDFHRQDLAKEKWQWAKLTHLEMEPKRNEKKKWLVNMKTEAYFEGLMFNQKDGAFLSEKTGQLNLNFALQNKGGALTLDSSYLEVESNKYFLDGKFDVANDSHFQLNISIDGVRKQEVMPLLSPKINYILRGIKIDEPLVAKFSMDKFLKSGNKEVVKIDFASTNTRLEVNEVEMTNATFAGYFSNDCDESGIGSPATACIKINNVNGDIMGLLPSEFSGIIKKLKDPEVVAFGKMNVDFLRINKLLVDQEKFTFTDGQAIVNFTYQGKMMNLLSSPFDEQDLKLRGDAIFDAVTVKTGNRYAPAPSLSGRLLFDENRAMLNDMELDWLDSKVNISGRVGNLPEFLFYDDEALKTDVEIKLDQLNVNEFLNDTPTTDKEKMTYDEAEAMLFRVASSLNGKIQLEVGRMNYDTLFVTDLKTNFQLFTPRNLQYIDSSMIRVDRLTANFMNRSPIFLDLGFSRDSVTDVWLKVNLPSAVEVANFFSKEKFKITKGEASLNLAANVPLRSLFEPKFLLSNLTCDGKMVYDKLDVDIAGFTWPVKKLSGTIAYNTEEILLNKLKFFYEGSPFSLDGKIKDYAIFNPDKTEKAAVDLNFRGQYFDLKEVKKKASPITKKVEEDDLEKVTLSPTELFQSLDTIFHYATGNLNIKIDSIITDQYTVDPFLLQARLVADENNAADYQLQVDSFNLGFGKKNNLKGSAVISNPAAPKIKAHFKARMKFKKVGEFLTSQFVEMKGGYFNMDLDYESPLYDSLTAQNYLLDAKIDGKAELVNGKIFYNYRDFTFDNIYGHFSFDQRAIYIRDLDLEVNGSRLIASGESSDFFPFFILPDRRANIVMKVNSPRFDFGGFTAPHGLGKDTMVNKVNSIVEKNLAEEQILTGAIDTTETVMETAGGLIDQLLDRGSIEMMTTCDELVYHNFAAHHLEGRISLQPDSVQIDELSMDVADGKFSVDGAISNVVRHEPKLEVAVKLKEGNLSEIFRQFDDFGQAQMGHKNLAGIASASINFQAMANSNYSILPETMFGEVKVKLTGGQLVKMEAMKSLPKFLQRKRKLDRIFMDTLESLVLIRGNELFIEESYLHSSSFDFGVQGIFSLGEEDNTRILFSIPVSNLYKKHLTDEEVKSGEAKRKGMRILVEASPKRNKLRFRWKPFSFSKKNYQFIEVGNLGMQSDTLATPKSETKIDDAH